MTGADNTLPDGDYTAVLDRFEDDRAVLEVAAADGLHEVVVEREALPADGRQQGAVLTLTMASGDIVDAVYDECESEARTEQAQSRFDRLSRRLGGGEAADQDDST